MEEANSAGEILAERQARIEARLEAIFDELPAAMGEGLLERPKALTAAMLADRAAMHAGFLECQWEKWGGGFDALRALLEAATELGSEYNDQFSIKSKSIASGGETPKGPAVPGVKMRLLLSCALRVQSS